MERKKRDKNFTEREKMDLIKITGKFKSILEDKKTNSQSVSRKNEVWEQITCIFNSTHEVTRSHDQLKNLYKFLKRKCGKDVAQAHDRLETCKTGGSEYVKHADDISEKISVLNKQIEPLQNSFDSTASLVTVSNETTARARADENVDNYEEFTLIGPPKLEHFMHIKSYEENTSVREGNGDSNTSKFIVEEETVETPIIYEKKSNKRKILKQDILNDMKENLKLKSNKMNSEIDISEFEKKNIVLKNEILMNELDIVKKKKRLLDLEIQMKEIELSEIRKKQKIE